MQALIHYGCDDVEMHTLRHSRSPHDPVQLNWVQRDAQTPTLPPTLGGMPRAAVQSWGRPLASPALRGLPLSRLCLLGATLCSAPRYPDCGRVEDLAR